MYEPWEVIMFTYFGFVTGAIVVGFQLRNYRK